MKPTNTNRGAVLFTKVCEYCHKEFCTDSDGQIYCSVRCFKKKNGKVMKYIKSPCMRPPKSPPFSLSSMDVHSLQTREFPRDGMVSFETIRDNGMFPGFCFARENGDLYRYLQILDKRQKLCGAELPPMTGGTFQTSVYTLSQLEEMFSISHSQLRCYIQKGILIDGERVRLKAVKCGRNIMVHLKDLQIWIARVVRGIFNRTTKRTKAIQRICDKLGVYEDVP